MGLRRRIKVHGAGTALQLLEQLQLSPVDSTEYFMVTNRSREEDADLHAHVAQPCSFPAFPPHPHSRPLPQLLTAPQKYLIHPSGCLPYSS